MLGFSCVADDNGAAAMMVIRALLHHLQHVSAIWHELLPTNVYLRSVGKLLRHITTTYEVNLDNLVV